MRIVRSCIRLLFVFPAVLLCYNRTAVIFHSLPKGASESKERQSVCGFPGPQGREGLPSRLSGIDFETTQASVIVTASSSKVFKLKIFIHESLL